jgi:hypothetical protein
MNFPSTNTDGRNPSLGGIVSNVGSSHGVLLDGGSTGGVVAAIGDDANISLTVRGKGTGGVTIGNSSQTVTLGQGSAIKGAFSTTFAYAFTALSSGDTVESNIASTTADIMPGDLIGAIELGLPAVSTHTISLLHYRTSTAATSRVVLTLGNITSTAIGSTGSGTGRITWFDLT